MIDSLYHNGRILSRGITKEPASAGSEKGWKGNQGRSINSRRVLKKRKDHSITGEMVTLATLSYFSSTWMTPFSSGVTVVEVVAPSAVMAVTV